MQKSSPLVALQLSPEVRPIAVFLPESLYPKVFLGLAPSVPNLFSSISPTIIIRLYEIILILVY
jgi:hypothetical protein